MSKNRNHRNREREAKRIERQIVLATQRVCDHRYDNGFICQDCESIKTYGDIDQATFTNWKARQPGVSYGRALTMEMFDGSRSLGGPWAHESGGSPKIEGNSTSA